MFTQHILVLVTITPRNSRCQYLQVPIYVRIVTPRERKVHVKIKVGEQYHDTHQQFAGDRAYFQYSLVESR